MIPEIKWFLHIIGSHSFMEYSDKIMCTCPYAPYTHSGGVDHSPSFGFRTTAKGNYRFTCFACGESGSIKKLYWDMVQNGRIPKEYQLEANNIAYMWEISRIGEAREYLPFEGKKKITEEEKQIQRMYLVGGHHRGESGIVENQNWLKSEDFTEKNMEILDEQQVFGEWWKTGIPEYYFERGYDEKVWDAWKLGYDEVNRRIMFPCYNSLNQLVGYTGRTIWEEDYCFKCGSQYIVTKEEGGKKKYNPRCPGCSRLNVKYKHHHGEWRRFSLYGVQLFEPRTPVILVEGSTDAIQLWRHGVRSPMAIFGSKPNATQFKWIKDNNVSKVYSCGDGDKAGREMNSDVVGICKQLEIPVDVILIPEGKDPGVLTYQEVREIFPAECIWKE